MKKSNVGNWFLLDTEALSHIRRAARDTITQSEMMLRASCARKWYYRYAMKLGKRGFFDMNLFYGSLIHSLLESLYSHKQEAYALSPQELPIRITSALVQEHTDGVLLKPNDHAEVELTAARAQIAFDAYRTHYYRQDSKLIIKGVEHILETRWGTLKLAAKLDMIAKPHRQDGTFIWDFKTAAQLNAAALDAWTFRFQFLFYCWLYWRVTGTKPSGLMINGLVKCALRPKVTDRKSKRMETAKEYLARVKADMVAKRERYFYRQRIPLAKDALERFEVEILGPHVDAFKVLNVPHVFSAEVNALAMQMNTNQCHLYNSYCEYLHLCKDGKLAISEYNQQDAKHPELTK